MRNSGLPQGAWIIVADGEKALLLINDEDDQDMNLVLRRKETQDNPQAQDWSTDRAERFAHLVILASRVVLAGLRKEMHQEVADKVLLEVPKVLTNHPLDEIETIVARTLQAA